MASKIDIDQSSGGVQIGKKSNIGFFGVTPVAQQSNLSDLSVTFTANDPSITADGAVTIADGDTPTVVELQEFCVELLTRVNALTAQLQNLGLEASS